MRRLAPTQSERGTNLMAQWDGPAVDATLALTCLQSSNLFEQGVAFSLCHSRHRRQILSALPADIDIPLMELDFLLACIEADITDGQQEACRDRIWTKAEAFLHLRLPLDPTWAGHNRLLSEERYFQHLAAYLTRKGTPYHPELATHVLEAWAPRSKPFSDIMKSWKTDPCLGRYVRDLETVLQVTF